MTFNTIWMWGNRLVIFTQFCIKGLYLLQIERKNPWIWPWSTPLTILECCARSVLLNIHASNSLKTDAKQQQQQQQTI